MVRFLCALLLLATLPSGAVDQLRPQPDPDVIRGKYLQVRLARDTRPAQPGATITLYADVTPGPKIHVYAPEQKDYISIALTTIAAPEFKAARTAYPPAVPFYFAPLRETVKVYDKPFRIAQDVTLASTPELKRRAAARATLEIAATLEYQACDDAVCYLPQSLPLTWRVPLGGAAGAAESGR
jgi:hypothetical protein